MAGKINVGLVQMQCSNNVRANLDKAKQLIYEAAKKGARLIILPELFGSLYFCHTEDYEAFELAEPIPGPTTNELEKVAASTGCGDCCFTF